MGVTFGFPCSSVVTSIVIWRKTAFRDQEEKSKLGPLPVLGQNCDFMDFILQKWHTDFGHWNEIFGFHDLDSAQNSEFSRLGAF
jgi:hypothetical protein